MGGLRRTRMTPVCVLVLYVCTSTVSAVNFNILALLDQKTEHYGAMLNMGVDYLNAPSNEPLLLNGDSVALQIIDTMDNDSYGAMVQVCDKLSDGVSVIVDVTSRYVTLTLRSLAEALGITHVASVDPSFYERESKMYNTSINVFPPSYVMLQVIRAIVKNENLTNVGIIYDDTFDFDDKPKRLLRNIPAQHMYLRMAEEDEEIDAQLDKIRRAELSHIFLASSARHANRYLGAANQRMMMNFKYGWYVLTRDTRLACSDCEHESKVVLITADTLHLPTSRLLDFMDATTSLGGPFDAEDLEMGEAFMFDLVRLVGMSLDSVRDSWQSIDFVDCMNFTETDPEAFNQAVMLKNYIANTSTEFVGGRLGWHEGMAEGSLDMHLTIKRLVFNNGMKISENPIGSWSESQGLNGTVAESDIKKQYRVVTVLEPPFVFKSRKLPKREGVNFYNYYTPDDGGWYFYGYCIDLLYHINQTMQFDFTLQESSDGSYGTMQQDGSWSGMVNDLIQDEADIIASPFSVMAERENVIDFTVPYYDLVGITILMKKPPFDYSVFKFMSVLEEAVWGCVLSAFIIVSILLAVFDRYSPYSYQNNKTSWDGQGDEPRVFTLKEGLWFCMTSLTPQGGGEAPRALSGRLLAATWWVFGFIMIATYTANLAAFLTVSRLEQPIESLDDLAKQFKTKYAPQESTATETYFRRMADIEAKFYTIWKDMSLNDSLDELERAKLAVWDYPVSDKFTNMWASMESSGFPRTFHQAKQRIKKPGKDEEFAFIGDATQNKYATLTDCDLWEVGEEFSRKPYALAVQEGSPLKNELSSRILELLNQRVLEDLKTKWWDFDRKDCPKLEDESDGISIYNIGGVFLVIFIGIGLGLMTLGFEYYWYKWRPAAKRRHKQNGALPNSDLSNGAVANGTDNAAYETRQ